MPEMRLELNEQPAAEDFRLLVDGVRTFNRARTGIEWPRPVAYFVRDPDRQIVAGVHGTLWGRSMHIDALWVDEAHRGAGFGSKLMAAIEEYAAARACPLIFLETTSFQALPFYQKLGYRIFGELAEIAEGHTIFLLKKDLSQ